FYKITGRPRSTLFPYTTLFRSDGNTSQEKSFPVVGIGASAGGLEAFRELLQNLPKNPGMAFVLVQHLAPKYDSVLTQLLSRSIRSEEHTSELQSRFDLVCRLLL